MSALDKLNAAMGKIPENSQYSLDEIQEAATEDDASFLSGMSVEANSALSKNVTEVTMDDEEEDEVEDTVEAQEVEEPEEQEPQQNQLFNNNKKPKRPYTKKDKDNAEYFDGMYASWSLQEMSRRNAAGYTKMLVDNNKWVDIKYIGELLKNPDGELMYGGELHSRPSIPSPGLR